MNRFDNRLINFRDLSNYKFIEKNKEKKNVYINLHFSKTGGTTMFFFLKSSIKNEILLLENTDDWKKKKKIKNNLIIEGHTWGAHNLISERDINIFYLTMLRNPISRAKSDFKYGNKHYNFNYKFSEFIENYNPNPFVEYFGYNDLNLAKKRIENNISFFGITEFFKESICFLNSIFKLNKQHYHVHNKSGNDFNIPNFLKKKFINKNYKDFELYNFARDLFEKRYKLYSMKNGLSNLKQISSKNSFQKGLRESDPKIASFIKNKKIDSEKLIIQIKSNLEKLKTSKKRYYRECIALYNIYASKKNYSEADKWIMEAYKFYPSFVFRRVISNKREIGLKECKNFIFKRLLKISKNITKNPFDSPPNKEIDYMFYFLKEINYKPNHYEEINKLTNILIPKEGFINTLKIFCYLNKDSKYSNNLLLIKYFFSISFLNFFIATSKLFFRIKI